MAGWLVGYLFFRGGLAFGIWLVGWLDGCVVRWLVVGYEMMEG